MRAEMTTNLVTLTDPVAITGILPISFTGLLIGFAVDFFAVKFGMQHCLTCEVSKDYTGVLCVSSDGNVYRQTVDTTQQ
jgi:hypothetical protein